LTDARSQSSVHQLVPDVASFIEKETNERPTSNFEWEKFEETKIVVQGLTPDFLKQMRLNCGAKRHHYLMFNVGRSMFIFQNNPVRH
jgi:hypothetical protein